MEIIMEIWDFLLLLSIWIKFMIVETLLVEKSSISTEFDFIVFHEKISIILLVNHCWHSLITRAFLSYSMILNIPYIFNHWIKRVHRGQVYYSRIYCCIILQPLYPTQTLSIRNLDLKLFKFSLQSKVF